MKLAYLFLLVIFQGVLIWYHLNLPKIYDWWKDNPGINICIFGPIIIYVGYYYWQMALDYFESLWACRFFGFSVNTIIFALMTWCYFLESPFELKTALCIFLAFLIVLIQIFL